MLKTLIVILVLVILLAIGLNIDFSNPPSSTIEIPQIKTQKESMKIEKNDPILPKKQIIKTSLQETDNNLSNEVQALFIKANNYFQNSLDEEAQNTYSLIIKKVQDNNQTKFLKYFAEAYKQKAFLFKIYPTYDSDSAIEMLEFIVKKFEMAEEFELIEFYINAKIEQAYLQTKEDSLETYDQLLNKFKNRTEPYFKKKIEELLLAKSFALMGEDDDEAMEILDQIINKYQKSGEKKLPDTIKFSILNNIELAIITNNDDSNYRELADTYMTDSPDKEPLLDMLNIIRNSQDLNQDEALKTWQEKHNSYHFPDWSFDELRKWAYRIEDKETKERVSRYIDIFENHKYYISSTNTGVTYTDTESASENKSSDSVTIDSSEYTPPENEEVDETKPEEYTDPYSNNDTPVVYEDDPYATATEDDTPTTTYEPDPYANDIPVIYEDPYSNEEGVSYEPVEH